MQYMSRWLHPIAVFVVTLMLGAVAAAQPADRAVLQGLASDDYATRQRMTEQLLRDDQLTVDRVTTLYAAAETPEQRHRLLDVARHHAIRQMRRDAFDQPGDRGAVGMTHRRDALPPGAVPGLDTPAVEVIQPMPGFPAYAHLRRGDLVIALDGEPLYREQTMSHFNRVLQSHKPGQELDMTIHRDGQRLELTLRLAAFETLNLVYNPTLPDMMLRSPFREQWLNARAELLAKGPAPRALRVEALSEDEAR